MRGSGDKAGAEGAEDAGAAVGLEAAVKGMVMAVRKHAMTYCQCVPAAQVAEISAIPCRRV